MVVTYTTVAGRIVHENRGGVERFYGSDPLGSTAVLYDASGNKTDEWTYWPYGEVRSHTGSSTTPFTFVGTLGYYTDLLGQLYVRARILMTILARWLTVDPLWPGERAYGYVGAMPARYVDSSRLAPWWLGLPGVLPRPLPYPPPPTIGGEPGPGATCGQWNVFVWTYCDRCYKSPPWCDPGCAGKCSQVASWYYDACKGGRNHGWPDDWAPGTPPGGAPGIYPVPPPNYGGPGVAPPPPPPDCEDCDAIYSSCQSAISNGDVLGICSSGIPGNPYVDYGCFALQAHCVLMKLACQTRNAIRGC